jgi:proline iminopeptidase
MHRVRPALISSVLVVPMLLSGCGEAMTRQEQWVQAARDDLAADQGVDVADVEVVSFEEVVWPDSSLGCPEEGQMYSQATQKGFRILLESGNREFAYHGSEARAPFLCRPAELENGSFTVDLNGFPIHYEIHGQGPVVMVVPDSWGLSLAGLRGLLGAMEERATMVYFDPRGMGGSGEVEAEADMSMAAVRADFDALREHLGLKKVHAIGWSNGAGNLILLAREKPETLASAIFLHGVASYTQEDAVAFAERYTDLTKTYMALMQEMADPSLTDEIRTERLKELWLNEFFPLMMGDPETGLALLNRAFGSAEFSWAHSQFANQESQGFDMRDQLSAIPVRSLVIAGAHDMSPPEKVKELADGLKDSVYVLFEDSGHFSPLEEPKKFQELVFDFLDVE